MKTSSQVKTILITGASTGIGRETARYFARQGWNVAATMRTPQKGTDLLAMKNVKIFPLDVLDVASIDAAIQATLDQFGGIDVLFNNAGFAIAGAFEAISPERIEKQFATNVFGVMNTTRAILPYFRQKRSGLIINTTSSGGRITFPLYSVYNSTKWAVEGFMESLQYELKPFNIRIKNIEPGTVKSDFENAIEYVPAPAYDPYAQRVHQNTLASYKDAAEPVEVAEVVYQAATSTDFRLRYAAGRQPKLAFFLRWLLPLNTFNKLVAGPVEKPVASA